MSFGFENTTDDVLAGIDLAGKRAIVTGASGGLGEETARALAATGAAVTITARDVPKGDAAAAKIRQSTGNADVDVRALELADLESVRAFAEGYLADHDKLDLLVQANTGKLGFTYSHYLPTPSNLIAIERAVSHDFCINLSADSLPHADELSDLLVAPVVSLVPLDSPHRLHTPEGRKVILCPAQSRDDVTCMTCRLCARIDRTTRLVD